MEGRLVIFLVDKKTYEHVLGQDLDNFAGTNVYRPVYTRLIVQFVKCRIMLQLRH